MKYILACLWLLCYFPFVNSFVNDQQTVTLYLENLQSIDDELTYQTWESCLSFLEKNRINCCIGLKCEERNIDDLQFLVWLKMLENKGNFIIHSENCSCVRILQMNYKESDPENSLREAIAAYRGGSAVSLPISTSPTYFRDQFKSRVRKSDVIYIKGDPSNWTGDQFVHFRSNIEYLLDLGITFDTPETRVSPW